MARCAIRGCWVVCLIATALASQSPRQVFSLDEGWRFHLGEAAAATASDYDDGSWRLVDVPHDYVVEGAVDRQFRASYPGMSPEWYVLHGFRPIQPAVYRKTLSIPAEAKGKDLWLEFDGVFSNSRYWLNGRQIGFQYSGYARSRFNISRLVEFGRDNVLVVQVDPRYDGWWYEGGGIYRHVRLVAVDPVHVAPDGVVVNPQVSDIGDGERGSAEISAATEVANTGSDTAVATLESDVLDADDHVVVRASKVEPVAAGSCGRFSQKLSLPEAHLWAPATPYLYRLRTTIRVAGVVVDQLITKFGVRQTRFDPEHGFFLNGRRLELQGVNIHEDHAGVGVAVPDRLFTWRLERLKEMGCNAIRFSHNPVEPFLLDECDRLGFLVIAENRHLGDSFEDQVPKDTPAVELRDLSAMVIRDRNHPCIVLWSLCNEQWIQGTPEAAAIALAMKARVRELDPTRPVTAAINGSFDSKEGMMGALDVIGINYHPDVYDSVHQANRGSPIVATEIASEIATRGFYGSTHWENYWGDPDRGYVSAYSINAGPGGQTVEDAWPAVVTREYIAGGFVWAGFDYKGEPRPFGWPVINSHYGFMDTCGFPKDSYYYYRAWWTNEPVLHLFPHWNWPGKEGKEISVWVHSNCDEVELFLNGVSQGKQKVRQYRHLEWKVKYQPGRLTARGTYRGKVIEDTRETTGAPAAIRLIADRSSLAADGADLSVVTVEVVDAKGRVVPIADNKIHFTLSGPARLIGVGNGDPSCHEPDKGTSRSAFNGLAQAIVQTTSSEGAISFGAESPGLQSAAITLESR